MKDCAGGRPERTQGEQKGKSQGETGEWTHRRILSHPFWLRFDLTPSILSGPDRATTSIVPFSSALLDVSRGEWLPRRARALDPPSGDDRAPSERHG